nr:immunoglobulin light chain junction region [Macaca mulatta]MOW56392.1 immunoglobulin light chain junction region [Macaca mulatta]MOW56445.1 immunoglobulin light chain junction region [Macaca mulatta]MOW56462.1 immunoglobulin light chain junction region [Macaca mulatta]MOW56585.1 immunoglobulin light chain junction region [Macaca mulatta]
DYYCAIWHNYALF